MRLNFWDQRLANLEKTTAELYKAWEARHTHLPKQIKDRQEGLKGQCDDAKIQFEEAIHFVMNAQANEQFMSLQEKTILYWTREFASRLYQLYQENLQTLRVVFFARLVHTVALGLTTKIGKNEHLEYKKIKAQQRQMEGIRNQLSYSLHGLKSKKQKLLEKYNELVVIKNNYESCYSSLRNSWETLATIFANKFENYGTARKGSLTQLSLNRQRVSLQNSSSIEIESIVDPEVFRDLFIEPHA